MQKKVTEQERINVQKNESLYKWLIGLLVGVIFIALTSFISSVQKKADIEYVDKKAAILEQGINDCKTDAEKKFDRIDDKLDKLIDMHLEKK